MRRVLFILLTLIALVSCRTSQEFLKHKEVVQEMNTITIEDSQDEEEESTEVKARREQLVPLDEFFKNLPEKNKIMSEPVGDLSERKGADLRYRDTPIKSQWNGTCTTFGGVAIIENLMNKPKNLDLSERDSWHWYAQYSSDAFVKTLKVNKICDEKHWPQDNVSPYPSCKDNRYVKLGDVKYIDDNIEAALDALDEGRPVYLAMTTPRDMLNCKKVISPYTGSTNGGHAIAIVGYEIDPQITGKGYFIIKNSWGEWCGDSGYQYVPFHLCNRNDMYCAMWDIKDVVVDNKPLPTPVPEPDYTWEKRCYRVWYWAYLKKVCYWVKVPKEEESLEIDDLEGILE